MKPLAMLVLLLVTSAALIAAPVSPVPPVPPVAAFSVVCVPTTCLFDGHASAGAIVKFRWAFGDKVIIENRNPPTPYASHTYAIPGTYSVKLQVLDAAGKYDSVTIRVVVPPIVVVTMRDTLYLHAPGVFVDSATLTTPRTVWFTLKGAELHDSAGQLIVCQRLWGPSSANVVSSMPCELRLYPSVDSVLKAMAIP